MYSFFSNRLNKGWSYLNLCKSAASGKLKFGQQFVGPTIFFNNFSSQVVVTSSID